jgi:hypothetical protein
MKENPFPLPVQHNTTTLPSSTPLSPQKKRENEIVFEELLLLLNAATAHFFFFPFHTDTHTLLTRKLDFRSSF